MTLRNLAVLILLLAAYGCASGSSGTLPYPVYTPVITSLGAPSAPVASGTNVPLSVSFTNGEAPFTATWSFDTGLEPLTTVHSITARTDSHTPKVVNHGTANLTIHGTVQITDSRSNQVSRAFTIEVLSES
jgi:hypothetical protein